MDARTCRARAGGRGHRTCSRRRRPAATRSRRQRRHLAGTTPCHYPWEQWGSQETDALHAIDRLLSRAWPSRRQPPRCARSRGGRRGDLTLTGSSVPVMRERGLDPGGISGGAGLGIASQRQRPPIEGAAGPSRDSGSPPLRRRALCRRSPAQP